MRRIVWLATALVMTGLVAMTVARFVHTDLRLPILVATFSAYASLGFAVVLAGCAVAVRRTSHRRRLLVVAVIAALGLGVQLAALAPLFVGAGEGAGGSAGRGRAELTVMTSNLEFGHGDPRAVVRAVDVEGVDVLVLEEVTPAALSRLQDAGLGKLLPHRRGTAEVTAAGTMVFSRWALDDPRPLRVRNGGFDVRVRSSKPFRLLAVHAAQPIIEPKRWSRDLDAIRVRSTALTRQGPTVVVGDFNATRDHQPWRAILSAGVRDAGEQAGVGWQPTWPNDFAGWTLPLIAIDHVLTTRHFVATGTHTVVIPGTDHRALVAQLRSTR